jgi:large subunit ribosomal protein L10
MATKVRKQEIVSELEKLFEGSSLAIVADTSGITVAEITQLRRRLDKDNAKCRIAKNTLVKIATKDSEFASIDSLAKGPSAFLLAQDEPAAVAKTAVNFFKEIKKGEIRGGVFEGKQISANDIKGLAELPSKDVLLSSIMGGLDSGARGIAGIFEGLIRDIALLTEEVAKKNDHAA